jgi:integral membrane sensor domain MASE1
VIGWGDHHEFIWAPIAIVLVALIGLAGKIWWGKRGDDG